MNESPKAKSIWRIQSTGNSVGLVEAIDVFSAIDIAANSLEEKRRAEFRDGIFQVDRIGYRIGEWEKIIEQIGGKRI
jgi:hypothetical protein